MLALQRISRQLAQISTVREAKELRDKAEAVRVYSRQQQDCKAIEREAVVIRLRAERRLGELLAKSVGAGNPNCRPGRQLPAGISRDQSSKWQLVAEVPVREFERYLKSRLPTTKGLVKLAIERRRQALAKRGPDVGGNVLTGDMSQLLDVSGQFDLILTDPPYGSLESYSRLAELAAAKLKPGGFCLTYSGNMYLPEIMERMGKHLDYFWTFAVVYATGHSKVNKRRILQSWKPVLAFSKGKAANAWLADYIRGGGTEKDLHRWQQPQCEVEFFIEKLTEPGELVVDPYTGSGTTLVAAKKLARRWLGCEIDKATARCARRRLAA